MNFIPSAGLELELPVVSRRNGCSVDARPGLAALLLRCHEDGIAAEPNLGPDGDLVGVLGDWGLTAFDNGYNNIEIAFAPVADAGNETLNRLAQQVRVQLQRLDQALGDCDSTLVNLAEHPDVALNPAFYRQMCVPKCIYSHWVSSRGWDHAVGIDAKAQNGPTTGVAVGHAVEALNLSLLAAPALIALYANSPFESGRATGLKENRLQMWQRMFAPARHSADRRLSVLPPRPFIDLADYFTWMFGADTVMHALSQPGGNYKSFGHVLEIEGDPSLLEFLAGGTRLGRCTRSGENQPVTPSLAHFEQLQFAHFLDARIRFGFARSAPLDSLLAALNTPGGGEALFSTLCSHVYIESRCAGTNLPDALTLDHANEEVAASIIMGPSAIQKGLLGAQRAWQTLSAALPWRDLAGLRDAAIRSGMDGRHGGTGVRDFCAQVLSLAYDGLPESERWMLAHPIHVLDTGMSGADHALRRVANAQGDMSARLRGLTLSRRFVASPVGRFSSSAVAG